MGGGHRRFRARDEAHGFDAVHLRHLIVHQDFNVPAVAEAEIHLVRPRAMLCLERDSGAVGTRALCADHASGAEVRVTYHPSAVLRAPDATASAAIERALVEDLLEIAHYL